MKKPRYIYAVLSIVKGDPEGVTSWPLLGVHSNQKSANSHFEAVKKDRVDRRVKVHWDHYMDIIMDSSYHRTIRECYMYHPKTKHGPERESLVIERYGVCSK